MTPGERIRAARQQRGLNQKHLAGLAGVSVQAVSQWERGKNSISFANANVIANILDVDVMWLMQDAPNDAEEIKKSFSFKHHGRRAPIVRNQKDIFAFSRSNVQPEQQFNSFNETIELTFEPIGQPFAIFIDDVSMNPLISVGDLAVFDNGVIPRNGDIVIALLFTRGLEVMVRKYFYYETPVFAKLKLRLEALNPEFGTIFIGEENQYGMVVGTMIEHRRFRIAPK